MAVKGSGQLSLTDLNDVIVSDTKPTGVVEGALWFDSVNKKLYVYENGDWRFVSDGMQVGGRNLVRLTDFTKYVDKWTAWNANTKTPYLQNITLASGEVIPFLGVGSQTGLAQGVEFGALSAGNDTTEGKDRRFSLIAGQEYTLSYLVAVHSNTTSPLANMKIVNEGGVNQTLEVLNQTTGEIYGTCTSPFSMTIYKYSFTFTASETCDTARLLLGSTTKSNYTGTTSWSPIYFAKLMLEEGNTVSSYSPAPEDIDERVTDVEDTLGNIIDDSIIDYTERRLVKDRLGEIIGYPPFDINTGSTDFAGKVSGSTTANANIVYGRNTTSINSLPTSGNELGQASIDLLVSLDGTVTNGSSSTLNEIPHRVFSFNLIEYIKRKYGYTPSVQWLKDNVSSLVADFHGYGTSLSGNNVTFGRWNGSSWLLNSSGFSHQNATVTKISSAESSNPSVIIMNDGFVHYIAYPNAVTAIPNATTAPTVVNATTGGNLASGVTYYVKYTWVTANGETMPSSQGSVAVPTGTATNKLTVTIPAKPANAVSANIYIGTTSGQEKFQGNTATTTYTQTAVLLTTRNLPTSNLATINSNVATDYVELKVTLNLLPTPTSLDNNLVGTFNEARKSAINAGITAGDTNIYEGSTTYGSVYTNLETKYNALKSYLEGLIPIDPWDLSEANKDINITVSDKDVWRQKWLDFYQALEELNTAVAKKLRDVADKFNTRGIGIKVNYSAFATANNGEVYIHGFDSNGNPADVNGFLVVNGTNMTVPKFSLNPDGVISKGYIVYDSGTNKWYSAYIKTDGTWWRLDNSITAGAFTPDSTHYFCGTISLSGAENAVTATLWSDYKDYLEMGYVAEHVGKITNVESKVTEDSIVNTVRSSDKFNPAYSGMDYTFSDGVKAWRTATTGSTIPTATMVTEAGSLTGGTKPKFDGTAWVYYGTKIPVNPSNTYRIKFRVKQTVDPTTAGTANVYAGVAGYDVNKAPITSSVVGTHRYCAVAGSPITVADGWKTFEGIITGEGDDNHNQFIAGTRYIVPMFLVNYSGGNGDAVVDYCIFEDITDTNALAKKVSDVELKISADAITSTVTSSTTFSNIMGGKADSSALGDLATKEELGGVAGSIGGIVDDKISDLNIGGTYATKTELEQTSTNITAKFSATGGMNLLKNSVGYADFITSTDYTEGKQGWIKSGTVERISRVSTADLDVLGFGSGFRFTPNTVAGDSIIYQDLPVVAGKTYTLSWYWHKTSTTASDGALYVQMQEKNPTTGAWETWMSVSMNGSQTTTGFTSRVSTEDPDAKPYIAKTNLMRVRVYADSFADATVTGLMLTIGDVALQWSLATGESYNTNVRLDINGIRVSQLNSSRKEIGYTQITPDEFAGYWDSDGDGNFEKVFYLNGDETVTKKLKALNEITMGNLKIININQSGNNGWAFVPIT